MGKELTPQEVLADLFEEWGEEPEEAAEMAELCVQRLVDAGFKDAVATAE